MFLRRYDGVEAEFVICRRPAEAKATLFCCSFCCVRVRRHVSRRQCGEVTIVHAAMPRDNSARLSRVATSEKDRCPRCLFQKASGGIGLDLAIDAKCLPFASDLRIGIGMLDGPLFAVSKGCPCTVLGLTAHHRSCRQARRSTHFAMFFFFFFGQSKD